MEFRIFSHRGYKKENCIEGLKNSYVNGYRAIEFDIWYLNDILLLSHDQPMPSYENYELLENFLVVFKNQLDYWLDFKNLNENNSIAAIKKLKILIDRFEIDHTNLYFAPFITNISAARPIYKTIRDYFGFQSKILAVCEDLQEKNYRDYYQILKDNQIYGLSINYKNINQKFIDLFKEIEVFAWTVNNLEDAQYLIDIGVRNITSDFIIPSQVEFYAKT